MNAKIFSGGFFKHILSQLIPNVGTILVVAVLLLANNAYAAGLSAGTSPSTISYQGTLATAGGMPLNASVGLTFRLYNVQAGGTALWTEAHTGANAVPVSGGLFNTTLGSITPIPTSVWSNSTVYLGVWVADDSAELSPREMVSAVPMAMMTANIIIPDNSVTISKIADGAVTSAKLSRQFQKNTLSSDYFISTPWVWNDILTYNLNLSRDTLVTIHGNLNCYYSGADYYCGAAVFVDGVEISRNDAWGHNGVSEGNALTQVLILSTGAHTITLRAMSSTAQVKIHAAPSLTNLIIIQG